MDFSGGRTADRTLASLSSILIRQDLASPPHALPAGQGVFSIPQTHLTLFPGC